MIGFPLFLDSAQTIKYLLSLPEMRIAANALNRMGLTALDVLERSPRDFVGVAIQYIFNRSRGSKKGIIKYSYGELIPTTCW